MKERTIRVTGKGKISVKPDLTIISVGISGKDKEYSVMLEKSAQMIVALKKLFIEVGIDPAEVQTASFGIDTVYRTVEECQNEGVNIPDFLREKKKIFDGYRFDL